MYVDLIPENQRVLIPLNEMVGTLAEKTKGFCSETYINYFNNLLLEEQIGVMLSLVEDEETREGILHLAERLIPGNPAIFGYKEKIKPDKEDTQYRTESNIFFIGDKGLYFRAGLEYNAITLAPMIATKNRAYINKWNFNTGFLDTAREKKKGDVELNFGGMAPYEGWHFYKPREGMVKPQTIIPYISLQPDMGENKKSFDMLIKAVEEEQSRTRQNPGHDAEVVRS